MIPFKNHVLLGHCIMAQKEKSVSSGYSFINEELLLKACDLGRNEALALIVISSGTHHTKEETHWSAQAVQKRLLIDWKYAKNALNNLEKHGLITDLKREENKDKKNPRPKYKINSSTENRVWFPQSFIDPIVDQSTGLVIQSPIERIKKFNDVNLIKFIFYLYKHQDLVNEAGISRNICYQERAIERIGRWAMWDMCVLGEVVNSFTRVINGKRLNDAVFQSIENNLHVSVEEQDGHWFWYYWRFVKDIGLLETGTYVFEGEETGLSYLYPIRGPIDAENAISEAATEYFKYQIEKVSLPEELREGVILELSSAIECGETIFPLDARMVNAVVHTVYRMRHRPQTKNTGEWISKINQQANEVSDEFLRNIK